MADDKVYRDRNILTAAQSKGPVSTLFAFFRLSGPGWLQSAITLGGGSLGGALYLGMLGGTSMLWLQLVAIVIGVIMLSAIAYVTLSTGKRPYAAINEYVNPVLGVGWITATILANMIWILPQFSLCYDALENSLFPGKLPDNDNTKLMVTLGMAALALVIVVMSFKPGWMSRTFDWLLKIIVGVVVICFVAVSYRLFALGEIDWAEALRGFIPDFSQWNSTAPEIDGMLAEMPGEQVAFWEDQIVEQQRSSMIGVTATAVGLNMTFLLPYSMLARKWDKPFRGLARFDLITAMAIPYIIVTTCIVIASAHAFHAKADEAFLSDDPAVMQTSVLFESTMGVLEKRYNDANDDDVMAVLNDAIKDVEQKLSDDGLDTSTRKQLEEELDTAKAAKAQVIAEFAAGLTESEKRIAPTLVKPNTKQLAATLAPLFGEGKDGVKTANLVFGLGALAMGFSTIIILMLINGYAFAEIIGQQESTIARTVGALAAVAVGCCWFVIWAGGSKTWLVIVASTFGAILLPIAYVSFFALMNNRSLLGVEKPTGVRMTVWNLLMAVGVIGAIAQAYAAVTIRMEDPVTGKYVVGALAMFGLLALVGFSARFRGGGRSQDRNTGLQ
ncbi:MAG: divalent metal cation transporter [Planctomycetota bacterium]